MPPSETSVSAMLYVLMLYLSRFPGVLGVPALKLLLILRPLRREGLARVADSRAEPQLQLVLFRAREQGHAAQPEQRKGQHERQRDPPPEPARLCSRHVHTSSSL